MLTKTGVFFKKKMLLTVYFMLYLKCTVLGGDLASTWVAKPEVHAEHENARKSDSKNINANDENFAGQAIAA